MSRIDEIIKREQAAIVEWPLVDEMPADGPGTGLGNSPRLSAFGTAVVVSHAHYTDARQTREDRRWLLQYIAELEELCDDAEILADARERVGWS